MDQKQLQIARSALWHQTAATDPSAPLRTFDGAARWLDDIGLCLFLPRHTQLPAPAPSFVEACSGASSVTPPPAAIAEATEFVTRLTGERRLVPLNLLGAFAEQPDFLVTAEILPWVAAVRGDRQWKTPPGGRTAPIVLRTWEALDREGELTAVEIREILGRELTEAAVLRALIELWTNLRAMPISRASPPAGPSSKPASPPSSPPAPIPRRPPPSLVLVSLYLRSAVAATAEEAEVLPLPAHRPLPHPRSPPRHDDDPPARLDHRRFANGALRRRLSPRNPSRARAGKTTRSPATRASRPVPQSAGPTRWELPARSPRPEQERPRAPWQKKPAVPHRPEPSAEHRGPGPRPFPSSRPDSRPGARPSPRPDSRPSRPGAKPRFGPRPDARPARPGARPSFAPRPNRPGAKPWQRRDNAFRNPKFPKPNSGSTPERQSREPRPPRAQPWHGKDAAPSQPRPWQKDRPRPDHPDRPAQREQRPPRDVRRPGENRPFRPKTSRPAAPFGTKPSTKFRGKPASKFGPKPFAERGGKPGNKFSGKPGGTFSPRPGAQSRSSSPRASGPGKSASSRPFRPGKPSSGKPNYPARGKARPSRPAAPKNKFRKSPPTEPNPRKNRSQKENPE